METKLFKIEERLLSESWEAISKLLVPHWEESSRNKELMVLLPDKDKYKLYEDSGNLLSLFAYVNGNCVGYSINIITNHLHYADLICGYNDVIFLSDEHRNSPIGIRLIKETKKRCKERGAELMLWHAKENTPLAKILPRLNCKVQEIVFSEVL